MKIKNISPTIIKLRTKKERISVKPLEVIEVPREVEAFVKLLIADGKVQEVGQESKKVEIDLSLSDEEIMKSFTVDDLKKFCKDSEFKGYSKLNQEELISFIRENTKEA